MQKGIQAVIRAGVIFMAGLFLTAAILQAKEVKMKARFQYAVEVTCGVSGEDARLLPGKYATSVNIFNPERRRVSFAKRLALAFPLPEQAPGQVSDAIMEYLRGNQALEVDCGQIPAEFFPGDSFPSYVEVFLVIYSGRPLGVTAL